MAPAPHFNPHLTFYFSDDVMKGGGGEAEVSHTLYYLMKNLVVKGKRGFQKYFIPIAISMKAYTVWL